jgi:hypothetical protein
MYAFFCNHRVGMEDENSWSDEDIEVEDDDNHV